MKDFNLPKLLKKRKMFAEYHVDYWRIVDLHNMFTFIGKTTSKKDAIKTAIEHVKQYRLTKFQRKEFKEIFKNHTKEERYIIMRFIEKMLYKYEKYGRKEINS